LRIKCLCADAVHRQNNFAIPLRASARTALFI